MEAAAKKEAQARKEALLNLSKEVAKEAAQHSPVLNKPILKQKSPASPALPKEAKQLPKEQEGLMKIYKKQNTDRGSEAGR